MIARENLRELLYKYYEKPFAAFFDWIGFTPNMVTLLGLLIILISAIFISVGYFWIGGIYEGFEGNDDTDCYAVSKGKVSVTPIDLLEKGRLDENKWAELSEKLLELN